MAEHGDAKLTDLLVTLAACPKAHSVSVHDRCKAVYGQCCHKQPCFGVKKQKNGSPEQGSTCVSG
jgi:hypothetical protein